jgi:hypothetical protein
MELMDSIAATDEPDMTDEDDVIEAWEIRLGFVIYSRFIFCQRSQDDGNYAQSYNGPIFWGALCSRAIVSENRVYHV